MIIRPIELLDIATLVALSKVKRLRYETAQSQFWRYAGPAAEQAQAAWFEELLNDPSTLMLTAQSPNHISLSLHSPEQEIPDHAIQGFIIGKLVNSPEVYNPGGLTLMIDDFCVQSDNLWATVGAQLITHIKQRAIQKGAAQILVNCGAHDRAKRQFLMTQNLSIASEWFVGTISTQQN